MRSGETKYIDGVRVTMTSLACPVQYDIETKKSSYYVRLRWGWF